MNAQHFEDSTLGFFASCVIFAGAFIFLGLIGWCGGIL